MKPCPHCGAPASVKHEPRPYVLARVSCTMCGAAYEAESELKVCQGWDRRVESVADMSLSVACEQIHQWATEEQHQRERAMKAEAEVERVSKQAAALEKQFGTCSVCGYIAWKDRDSRTEECQFCKLQKQAAAMREAIQDEVLDGPFIQNWVRLRQAIKDDAGRDHIHRDAVKPLITAIHSAEQALQKLGSIRDETRIGWALQEIEKALDHAKAAGLGVGE